MSRNLESTEGANIRVTISAAFKDVEKWVHDLHDQDLPRRLVGHMPAYQNDLREQAFSKLRASSFELQFRALLRRYVHATIRPSICRPHDVDRCSMIHIVCTNLPYDISFLNFIPVNVTLAADM